LSDLDRLRLAFALPSALLGPPPEGRAAVAAVFRKGDAGAELLFIERARRASDPWSGHMALPGGRVDPGDADTQATAERETHEEVGLDLRPAERLGQLDDLHGGIRRITVSAHGYWLDGGRPALQPNHEVAETLWIPLGELTDPRRVVAYRPPRNPAQVFPGVELDGGQVVWGLTLRMLQDLFRRLGHPFLTPG
jgi:8-oxo-dGTP pyrophosphatase MutT (NUDIX family)